MKIKKSYFGRFEKRANKIMMKASQTLEQSTGLAIGPRRSMGDSCKYLLLYIQSWTLVGEVTIIFAYSHDAF